MSDLTSAILNRRTTKPSLYSDRIPDPEIIRKNIEISRHAPNHHRTEPARFYLLDLTEFKIGKLFGEIVAGDLSDPSLVERGKKKSKEWGHVPGLLIVTCLTEINSELVRKNPEVADEDYATCCCICQNLLLLLANYGIATKWSTGAVWKHPEFAKTINMISPQNERVVGLILWLFRSKTVRTSFVPIENHLKDFTSIKTNFKNFARFFHD